MEDRLGFRAAQIRLRSQIAFSLFGASQSKAVVVGRDNVLFQPNVIDGYLGRNFIGAKELAFRVRRLRIVQDDLQKRGTPLLLVLAPGKARYQAEDLPLYARLATPDTTNYEVYRQQCEKVGIQLLDAIALFQQWKATTPYPLFPKGGTHWSAYGAARVADTLFRRMESMAGINLPDYRVAGPAIIKTDSLTEDEDDLSGMLNLLQSYRPYPMAHLPIVFEAEKPGQTRPNVLIVGDSFIWGLITYAPYLDKLFDPQSRLWFYYNGVYSLTHPTVREEQSAQDMNLAEQIASRKFFIMLTTEHNLVERDYGFIDRVYELYHPLTDAENLRIKAIGQQMLTSPALQKAIWEESYKTSRSPDELIYDRARAHYDRTERGADLLPFNN